jgi:membrane protein YdbS with pleckstrin-like domain
MSQTEYSGGTAVTNETNGKGSDMEPQTQTCANCTRLIGRLEKACLWQDHSVCQECYDRLAASAKSEGLRQPHNVPPTPTPAPLTPGKNFHDEEAVAWAGHPSILPRLPVYLLLGLLAIAALAVALAARLPWVLLGLIPCALGIAIPELRRRTTSYLITRRTLVVQQGIVSRARRELRLQDIREVTLDQGVLERLCNLGKIGVSTAATADAELHLQHIRNPKQIVQLLQSLRS